MKKRLMIFIIAIISIIPISNINAKIISLDTNYYEQTEYDVITAIEDKFNSAYPNLNFEDYEVVVFQMFPSTNYIWFQFNIVPKAYLEKITLSAKGSISFNYVGEASEEFKFYYDSFRASGSKIDLDSRFDKITSFGSSTNTISNNGTLVTSSGGSNNTTTILYSTTDIYDTNDNIIYYANVQEEKKYLSYEYELVNNNYYNIKFYSENFDSNYKYQIKFDTYDSWVDITNYLSNGPYSYTLTHNSTLYMQVLNENNEIIETETMLFYNIELLELDTSYERIVDDLGRKVLKIKFDASNVYNENYKYVYTYDEKTFYEMPFTSENKIFYLNHGLPYDVYFGILDSNNNFLSYKRWNFYYSEFSYLSETGIDVTQNYDKDNNLIIQKFDFSDIYQFSDIYNFKLVINGQEIILNEPYFKYYILNAENYVQEFDIDIYIDELNIMEIHGNDYVYTLPHDNYYDYYQFILDYEYFENSENKNDGLFDLFKNSLNEFKGVIVDIFENISYFFYSSPTILQKFYIVIFVVVLFGFLIKFIL